jgi:hypothetical protein
VVSEIPSRAVQEVFTSAPPHHLAYVKWFSPIPATPGHNHRLYKITELIHNGQQCTLIIPVTSILHSVHLFPIFGPDSSQAQGTYMVLEQCDSFYKNPFSDQDNYVMLLYIFDNYSWANTIT